MKKHALLLSLCCLLIAFCGFHPRQPVKLPQKMHTLYLNVENPYSPFSRILKKALITSGVKLSQSPNKAPIILSVTDDQTSIHQIGIGANQQVRNYEINSTLTYRLATNRGKVIVPETTIKTKRQIIMMPNEELFNTNKLNEIKASMRSDLIEQLLYKLAAVKK